MNRRIFTEEHNIFRDQVRRFVEKEVLPYHEQWERDGMVSRDLWRKAGEAGLLCCTVPEEYGGPGGEFLHSVIVLEELSRVGATGPGFPVHSDMTAPYIQAYGSEEQKQKWLPKLVAGELIAAIAMTEPNAGSDLQNIRTRAVCDGDDYVINGQKVFISNGQLADLVVVACKTNPEEKAKGVSLIVVETDRVGFRKGRKLEKIGLKAQDTSELFFEDVRVPASNLLGEEGQGFSMMMTKLAQERLVVALRAARAMETALENTIEYTKERQAFGKQVFDFQNSRFVLADMKTKVLANRAFVDQCTETFLNNELDDVTAAAVKLHSTETLGQVVDACLQLHGGWGYIWEYPIARAWADARITRILGGTSEIMKHIIGRSL
ncbi:acyl-CoA dehydrogenase family protein [Sulfitobacter geojensis]|uniref:acyl-CoA dehydrogenase family protein n=1 Tax=Sulfitobacter geojensis TaxID=1342299 RepID=UPI000467FF8C|nr:acyl-CoA dehydrogenase family protein [Sulfitobacter geojensis]KHA54053.1 Acyl-CoA dehydrogenase [Sulfitobacter geojensis]NYI29871.1 acyl-CoA dehydrogenase [Sulfitobacter geojensis]